MRNRLIVFDMDGVIFEHCNFWMELHKEFGTYKEGLELTNKYVKTDYAKLVEEVVGRLWKGKPADRYYALVERIGYIAGVKETISALKKKGYKTAIISSGAKDLALRAQNELGIDYIHTNELVIKDGRVTGEFRWPVAHGRKAVVFRNWADEHHMHLSEMIVVGDSDSDIRMMRLAGLGIAFCTESEELRKVATAVVEKPDLREILPHIDNFEKRELLKTIK
ncbi:HAD-IB family phosphatase [Candidatus Woesearchaeota archaeon]|nr:HAD-IB family phosphatase [Candidatus Woesearchaeota archaeon]